MGWWDPLSLPSSPTLSFQALADASVGITKGNLGKGIEGREREERSKHNNMWTSKIGREGRSHGFVESLELAGTSLT